MTLEYFKQRYGYEIEGMWMPRVTAVTSLLSRASVFAPSGAADWGTAVHEAVEHILKGDSVGIDQRISPSLEAFDSWKKQHSLQIESSEHIERRVVDEGHGYAGTVDLVASIQGRLGIIDLKTSSAMRDEYALQTAAYFFAYNSTVSAQKQCKARWILRIDQYQACKHCFAKKREKSKRMQVSGGNPFCTHSWGIAKGEVEFKELADHQEDLEVVNKGKERLLPIKTKI